MNKIEVEDFYRITMRPSYHELSSSPWPSDAQNNVDKLREIYPTWRDLVGVVVKVISRTGSTYLVRDPLGFTWRETDNYLSEISPLELLAMQVGDEN